jgi:hypothetical protein
MKYIITLLYIVVLCSCTLIDEPAEEISRELEHFELGFELDEPEVILNELAKGSLDRNIHGILRQHFDEFPEPVEQYWEFHYLPNSDRVSKMIYYSIHYGQCEQTYYDFHYNGEELLDSVVLKRENVCQDFEVDRVYTFNYSEEGLLKSVFMDNEYSLEQNYFGYYPNGKVKEIYSNYTNLGTWEPYFGVQKFSYDSTFSNVTRVEQIAHSNSHYSYEYFYDTEVNPFKDFFIAASVFMPHIGPAYLSNNNVIKMIKKNEGNITGHSFPYEYIFNFSDNVLDTYSDKEEDKMPYLLYTVNPQ